MKYYLCKEKGVGGTDHDCSSVKFVNGKQVCGAVEWQLDYAGHVFCGEIAGKIDIDEGQISMFDEDGLC